ncbi:hypothetical protein FHS09_000020 [Microbulbifer rhizosphaerae]|uniref:Uncharacterized protein n=1 Tax=Microbulbifer rhizosphaerae TaxID=1562603 RepID=A0A7W4Z8H3_9GAMM|nr:hypothetical protein [Microbulbifer rhizosphaerae]
MPNFIPHNYDQVAMIAINLRDQYSSVSLNRLYSS